MSILHRRRIRPNDLQKIRNHIARQGAWYGADLGQQLHCKVLEKLLIEHAVETQLVEQTDPDTKGTKILGLGVTGFLDLHTTSQLLKAPPSPPFTEYLYQREKDTGGIFLRPEEILFHNRHEGLVLVFLHFSAPQDSSAMPDEENVGSLLQSGFRYQYGGYNCRTVLHPVPCKDSSGVDSLTAQGFRMVSDQHDLMVFDLDALENMPFHPFACLRQTKTPKLGFSPAEKDLLLGALWGSKDAVIANELHITIETVRKRWRSIFSRFDDHPQISIFSESKEPGNNKRGSERRSLVLKYIDSHLEEIRP